MIGIGMGAVGPGAAAAAAGAAGIGALGGLGGPGIDPPRASDLNFRGRGMGADLMLSVIPAFGMANLAAAAFGRGLGSQAIGDPSGAGPGPGGPPDASTLKTVDSVLTSPRKVAVAPPEPETPVNPDLKRKRTGRQQTILSTGLLDEAPVLKATLLGQ